MSYNIEALKAKIQSLSPQKSSGDRQKLTFWKPTIGNHDVRFVALKDADGNPLSQPFFEVAYYDNSELSEKRFVAPGQFGGEDPLKQVAMELASDRSREAFLLRKKLTPKERYYSAILVRGEEEKGLQIWEMSPQVCKDIYTLLVMPDYADDDVFHPETGFDFTVSVTATDKTFNGHPVKAIKLVPRRKASKLVEKKEQREALLKSVPNFHAYFKAQVKSVEELTNIRDNFLASLNDDSGHAKTTNEGTSRGGSDSSSAVEDVENAFKDL